MGFILIMLLTGSFVLINNNKIEYIEEFKAQSRNDILFLSDLIQLELLQYKYKEVSNILEKWKNQNNNIYKITAKSSNGFLLANLNHNFSPKHPFSYTHKINYGYNGNIELSVTFSLDHIYAESYEEGLYLFILAFIMTLVSGQFLWLVEQKRYNTTLINLSYRDQLTEIFNRRYFDETLIQEWHRASRANQPLSLIMIDIDRFKSYNDTYGHQTGDGCLWEVATALHKTLKRPGEFVARYGGEEFAVVLPNINKSNVKHIAELLRKSIEKLAIPCLQQNSANGYVSISVGTATYDKENQYSVDQLIQEADLALYKAKKTGGNCVTNA